MNLSPWDAAAVLVKAVLYAATLGAAGGIFYWAGYARALLGPSDRGAIARLIGALIAVSLAASAARVFITAGSLSEDPAGMWDGRLLAMVWQGGEGRAALLRACGLLLAIPALARGRLRPLALLGAALAATSFVWVGHVRAAGQPAASLLLGAHLLAVAFWAGALGPLAIDARCRKPRALGAIAARFGRIAVTVVAALLLAGLLLLWRFLGSVAELWNSEYGRFACVKIGLVACLLAIAAGNKLQLVPRIRAGDESAVRGLRRSLLAEMLVAALILLITAALTTLAGPPSLTCLFLSAAAYAA